MPFRLLSLSIVCVLALSACVGMDDNVRATEQVVSTVVLDEATNQEFVVQLAYDDAQVTYEEAVVLLNDIGVVHNSGVTLADQDVPQQVLEQATGILYKDPRFNDLSQHEFQVHVFSETVDLDQIIQEYHWDWISRDIIAFTNHCPPGHGG